MTGEPSAKPDGSAPVASQPSGEAVPQEQLTRRERRRLIESGVLTAVPAAAGSPESNESTPGGLESTPKPSELSPAEPVSAEPVAQPTPAESMRPEAARLDAVDLSAPLVEEPTPSEVLTAPASRAGRNLPVALGIGFGLLALLILSLFVRKEAFGVFALVLASGAIVELRSALARQKIALPALPLIVGAAGMFISAYLAGAEALLVAFILTAGGVFVWCVLDGGGLRALRSASASIMAAAYLPFLASFLMLALALDDGPWRVLLVVLLAAACDTGGYAAGVLWGRHPMAPSVSPKKSWEGFAGSIVLASLVGAIATPIFLDGTWWAGAIVGVLAVLAAAVGDLGESLIKRDLGMKDMSSLLPGHGGILDRIDSLLLAAPVAVTALGLLVPVVSP